MSAWLHSMLDAQRRADCARHEERAPLLTADYLLRLSFAEGPADEVMLTLHYELDGGRAQLARALTDDGFDLLPALPRALVKKLAASVERAEREGVFA